MLRNSKVAIINSCGKGLERERKVGKKHHHSRKLDPKTPVPFPGGHNMT